MSWIVYSLTATFLFGFVGTLYKLPSNRGDNKFVATLYSMLVPFLLSVAFLFDHLLPITVPLILTSVGWPLFFVIVRYLYIESYHWGVDTNALTPFTGTLNLIGSVAIGILAFHERLTPIQWSGVILSLITIALFFWQRKNLSFSRTVLWLGLLIPVFPLGYKTFQKLGADHTDIFAFQIYSFGIGTLIALVVFAITHRAEFIQFHKHLDPRKSLSGFLIGLLSFLGGLAYLMALQRGPFALVSTIHSLYIVVTAVVSAIVFKERLTKNKIFLIVLAIIAAILIS